MLAAARCAAVAPGLANAAFRHTAPSRRAASIPAPAARRRSVLASAGGAGVEAWIDLASFLASAGKSGGHTPYDDLADKIGQEVYIEVAGWHLYLKDVKVGEGLSLAQALAAQLGPQLLQKSGREPDLVWSLLTKVPIKLGGGGVVPLSDLVPSACARDLERACEDWERSR